MTESAQRETSKAPAIACIVDILGFEILPFFKFETVVRESPDNCANSDVLISISAIRMRRFFAISSFIHA